MKNASLRNLSASLSMTFVLSMMATPSLQGSSVDTVRTKIRVKPVSTSFLAAAHTPFLPIKKNAGQDFRHQQSSIPFDFEVIKTKGNTYNARFYQNGYCFLEATGIEKKKDIQQLKKASKQNEIDFSYLTKISNKLVYTFNKNSYITYSGPSKTLENTLKILDTNGIFFEMRGRLDSEAIGNIFQKAHSSKNNLNEFSSEIAALASPLINPVKKFGLVNPATGHKATYASSTLTLTSSSEGNKYFHEIDYLQALQNSFKHCGLTYKETYTPLPLETPLITPK